MEEEELAGLLLGDRSSGQERFRIEFNRFLRKIKSIVASIDLQR